MVDGSPWVAQRVCAMEVIASDLTLPSTLESAMCLRKAATLPTCLKMRGCASGVSPSIAKPAESYLPVQRQLRDFLRALDRTLCIRVLQDHSTGVRAHVDGPVE